MTATGTPLPVDYCHALLMLSKVNPGAVTATFGSATVMVRAQMLLCRIGASGPGLPSGGARAGSTAGGGIACAAGRVDGRATIRPTRVRAEIRRDANVRVIACAPS